MSKEALKCLVPDCQNIPALVEPGAAFFVCEGTPNCPHQLILVSSKFNGRKHLAEGPFVDLEEKASKCHPQLFE